MKSMVRARKYPDTTLGAVGFLRGVVKQLEWAHRHFDIPVTRTVALCEAQAIVERLVAELKMEMTNKDCARGIHVGCNHRRKFGTCERA